MTARQGDRNCRFQRRYAATAFAARNGIAASAVPTSKLAFGAKMQKRSRDPRDAEIAKRLRALRLRRGMSQSELGSALGVTFQQVQKYEKGTNRVSAGRLHRVAETFDVPVAFFYAGVDGRRSESGSHSVANEFDFLQTGGAMRLVRAYSRIAKPGIRLRLLRLAEHLAGK